MIAPRERIMAFLDKHHASETPHTGRKFIEHLEGTERLLKEWEMPEHVQLAGLFHSIYGTNLFQVASASFGEREEISALIGPSAEWLAYLFCSTARPNAFLSWDGDGKMINRHTKQEIYVTNTERLELIAIEVANHIEQDMGKDLITYIHDRPHHCVLMTTKAMNEMRRFLGKHGVNR
jgi:hypothetical protein